MRPDTYGGYAVMSYNSLTGRLACVFTFDKPVEGAVQFILPAIGPGPEGIAPSQTVSRIPGPIRTLGILRDSFAALLIARWATGPPAGGISV